MSNPRFNCPQCGSDEKLARMDGGVIGWLSCDGCGKDLNAELVIFRAGQEEMLERAIKVFRLGYPRDVYAALPLEGDDE